MKIYQDPCQKNEDLYSCIVPSYCVINFPIISLQAQGQIAFTCAFPFSGISEK